MSNKQSKPVKPVKEILDGVEYTTSITYTAKGLLYTLSYVDSSGNTHSMYFDHSYDYVEYKAFLRNKTEIYSRIRF